MTTTMSLSKSINGAVDPWGNEKGRSKSLHPLFRSVPSYALLDSSIWQHQTIVCPFDCGIHQMSGADFIRAVRVASVHHKIITALPSRRVSSTPVVMFQYEVRCFDILLNKCSRKLKNVDSKARVLPLARRLILL